MNMPRFLSTCMTTQSLVPMVQLFTHQVRQPSLASLHGRRISIIVQNFLKIRLIMMAGSLQES